MSLAVEPGEALLTFAEISVAFTGFASIVAIFQKGSARGSESFDLFRFWIMLEFRLASLFFSLLPMVLHSLRLSDAAVWSSAGGVLILFMLAHAVLTSRLIRRGETHVVASLTRGLSIGANAVQSVILASRLLNLTGCWADRSVRTCWGSSCCSSQRP